MDLADWVNQEAISLWREYQNTFNIQEDVLLPLIYPPIKKSTLLFVGLNPSSNIEGLNDILFGTGLCPNNLRNFYSLNNIDNFDLQLAQKIERCSRERYPYFQRFDCISKYTKLSWEHIDLFFYRLTGQNRLKHKIFNDMNGFWDRQLALSKTLICKSAPIIIVVANAFGAEIFEEEFDVKFNEEIGCHQIMLIDKYIPVFLGSMLTGQRALDNYSFQRLKWHIKRVVDKLSSARLEGPCHQG